MTSLRQVNCYIPIKLRITGRLNDAQLDELGASLIHAITARMAQARHAIGHYGGASAHPTIALAREAFDPARLYAGQYGLPSYDEARKTVHVPVTGDIEAQLYAQLQDYAAAWEKLSKEAPTFDAHAYARRAYLLLDLGPENPLKTQDDFLQFIDACSMDAYSETDTLESAENRSLIGEDLLLAEGAAFANIWVGRVRREFYPSVDLNALQHAMESARSEVINRAANISDEIWGRGLPLTKNEARDLNLNNLVGRLLSVEHAKDLSNDVMGRYIRALWYAQGAEIHYVVVSWYKWELDNRIERIGKGDLVVDKDEYGALKGKKTIFQAKHRAFSEAAASGDMARTINALILQVPIRFYRVTGGSRYDWQKDDVLSLWQAIAKVDTRIAGTGRVESIWRALVWAEERDYFYAAGKEVYEAIKDNWLKMIGTLVAIIVVQKIPGLNVAVDLVLLIQFGLDAAGAALDLAGALKDAASANSVVEMEHAAVRLSSVLVGTTAEIALWAATWGTGKLAKELAKWRKVENYVKTHGDNMETRDALLKAKGNTKEAEKILTKKREYERQQSELELAQQRRKSAAPAKAHEPAPPPSAAAKFPEASVAAKGAKPKAPAAGSKLVEDVNAETKTLFERKPQLKKKLQRAPRAARALKKCNTPCFPDHVTPSQIDRLDRMLESAEDAGILYNEEGLTNYLRSKKNWQEFESALDELEKDLTIRGVVKESIAEREEMVGRDPTPEGRPATAALRAQPGRASGGDSLPEVTGQWFPEARDIATQRSIAGTKDIRVARIPGQIAKKMRGMDFRNFGDFRETFWIMVARDPVLKRGWTPRNLQRMEDGLAPLVAPSERIGGGSNAVYQLNHKQAIKNAGDVYNLDNIEVVGPRFHGEIGD